MSQYTFNPYQATSLELNEVASQYKKTLKSGANQYKNVLEPSVVDIAES